MKKQTLQALLVDQALGELDPMVSELLDAYIAHDSAGPLLRDEIATTLHVASQTLEQHPELIAHQKETVVPAIPVSNRSPRPMPAWMRAAAVFLIAAGIGGTGYWAGQRQVASAPLPGKTLASNASKPPIAWQPYRVAYDAKKGQFQIR